jgi:hypothetical protein
MSAEEGTEQTMRDYLMGQLSEERCQELEAEFLRDTDKFELLEAIEDELIQDFVAGDLPPGETEILKRRWRTHPDVRQQLAFAQALGSRAKETRVASAEKKRRSWLSWPGKLIVPVLACMVLLASYFGIRWLSTPNESQHQAQTKGEGQQPHRPAESLAVFSIVLTPQLTRSSSSIATFTVPPGTQQLRLIAQFPEHRDHSKYSAVLRTPEGLSLWAGGPVEVKSLDGKAQAAFVIALSSVPSGDMILTLSALGPDGQRQEIEDFSFRLM